MNKVTSFSLFLDRRMRRIFLLGVMSGFPWVLIGSSLSLWLKEDGLSRSAVGWAGLIFAVYAVNFLWAPLVDRLRLPYLTDRLGHRKSWILMMQVLILASLLFWSTLAPSVNITLVIGAGLLIAVCSATQDITIDALRIEQIDKADTAAMAAGASVAVIGWWSGFKIGGLIALMVADKLELMGFENYWQMTFILLGALVVLCNIGLLLIPETGTKERSLAQAEAQAAFQQKLGGDNLATQAASWIGSTVLMPLLSFFQKNGLKMGLAILSFIFLFKIGEAFMGKMSIIFYKEVGFSKSDIALYSKGLGWITTVVFTLLGGYFALKSGVVRALLISGVVMAATNILFSALAWAGKVEWLFAVAVILDDLAAAFATVAFVTFISLLVDRNYTATQYALLASIGTLGRTLLASSSGELVDWLEGDWGLFFIITAFMVIPSLAILWAMRKRLTVSSAS
ncbi:Major Facilitator Superfamily transporter [SAR116 cluster alpha proteobacterium HIMB100]|nr:Major Facilitator Superfamily transporter [SAR116 cluster alpha proteobacterium HIMB100]